MEKEEKPLTAEDVAVVVVDMQRGFLNYIDKDSAKAAWEQEVAAREARSGYAFTPAEKFRMVRSWHDNCLVRVYPGNDKTEALRTRIPDLLNDFRKAGAHVVNVHDVRHGSEARAASAIPIAPEDTIIHKNQDSAFAGSDIDQKVRGKRLVLCGVNFNACVKKSAIDAVKRGYKVYVLRDLSENNNGTSSETKGTMHALKKAGVIILKTREMLAKIGAPT